MRTRQCCRAGIALTGVRNPDAIGAIYDRIAANLCTLKNQIAERISSLAHSPRRIQFLQQLSPGPATQAHLRRDYEDHIADGWPKSIGR